METFCAKSSSIVAEHLWLCHTSLFLHLSVVPFFLKKNKIRLNKQKYINLPKKLIHATGKGKKDKEVDAEKLENVNDHPSEGYLKRSKVRIDREHVN